MKNCNWLEDELIRLDEIKDNDNKIKVATSITNKEVLRSHFEKLGFDNFRDTIQREVGAYTYKRGEMIISKYEFKLICLLGNEDIYIGISDTNEKGIEREIMAIYDYSLANIIAQIDDLKILIKNQVLAYLKSINRLNYNAICTYTSNCSLADRYYE